MLQTVIVAETFNVRSRIHNRWRRTYMQPKMVGIDIRRVYDIPVSLSSVRALLCVTTVIV